MNTALQTERQETENYEQMNIVIVGHVDHGKSTLIGRLLADTGSLPDGKLEQVKAVCAANSKPFEYAFLLDALKDEQAQGITIDTARSFFKTDKRHYIIIDAPGHIEFLKNMITGASRAESAILLIDAKEGVQENSRRHGYMLSLLGIKQVVVAVNKMDLVNYSQDRFNEITKEYTEFLTKINVTPRNFVPISAFNGDNLIGKSENTPWYTGKSILAEMDRFDKEEEKSEQPFRMPVQDIYKFTESGDDRRIVAGTIQTGRIKIGDKVTFFPSGKESQVKSIEAFNLPEQSHAYAGMATGVTLSTQIYIQPGETMVRTEEMTPKVSSSFRANLFWLGKKPMVKDKKYKIKILSNRKPVYLKEVLNVLDASELTSVKNKQHIDRHDVAECILQTVKPIAFDLTQDIENTGRFVIIDDYEIAGGGIIMESLTDASTKIEDDVERREFAWIRGHISSDQRAKQNGHKAKAIFITGPEDENHREVARHLEEKLFKLGRQVYYLGIGNLITSFGSKNSKPLEDRDEHLQQLGEISHMFTESGSIFISTFPGMDDSDARILKKLNEPRDIVVINLGDSVFNTFDAHLSIPKGLSVEDAVQTITQYLNRSEIISDYSV